MRRGPWAISIALLLAPVPAPASSGCQLAQYAQLPVTMSGTAPLIAGSINGIDALFIADSGSFFSALSAESAQRFKLRLDSLPGGMQVLGVGGAADARRAIAREFTLAGWGAGTLHNMEFVVVGNAVAGAAAGLIGQNLLGRDDAEYDLANGVIRLFHSKGCADRSMAYWQQSGAVGVIEIASTSAFSPYLLGTARLNGTRIRVMFDTGAARSMLSRRAAARAGVKTDGPDVSAAGIWSSVGRQPIESWLARFDSLDLGGEQIKNARLRIGDVDLFGGADMLLGADFFLSHHIYVAASQHRIYFTYNGGRVFDLSVIDASRPAAAAATDAPVEPAAAEAHSAEQGDEPKDAAGFRRRGAAFVARQDFRSAIADLDRAVSLEPQDPQNYFQRGVARWLDHQPGPALEDFDQALKLQPDYVSALMGRATLRLTGDDPVGARADFDQAAALAPNDASLDLRIAETYVGSGHFDEAIVRFDRWLSAYPRDDRLPVALDGRCRARARLNQAVDLALADCNAALRKGLRSSQVYEDRALVWLRLAAFDKAVADYKSALALQSKSARSRYGLGVAELRSGQQAQGENDIQTASTLDPAVAGEFRHMGLGP